MEKRGVGSRRTGAETMVFVVMGIVLIFKPIEA